MSGHSKWSKVKHQKAVTDAVKGKHFTKASAAIISAIHEGGGIADPNTNFKLRLAIEKAREVNMPKDNIERAIAKGKGGEGGSSLKTVVYEAFGPSGTAIIIEGTTDNNQRTTSNLKNVLDRGGGTLVSIGAASYLFDHVGQIYFQKDSHSFDDILSIVLEAGGDDVEDSGDVYTVTTHPTSLHKVLTFFVSKGMKIQSSELLYKPKIDIKLSTKEDEEKVLALLENIEGLDDVQRVHTNAVFTSP